MQLKQPQSNSKFFAVLVLFVLVQLCFGAHIMLFNAYCNFLLIYLVVYSVQLSNTSIYLLAFGLGLLADLITTTPLGLSSFAFLVVTATVRVLSSGSTEKNTVSVIQVGAGVFTYYLVFLIGMLVAGQSHDIISMLLYILLPGLFLNSLVGFIVLFAVTRFGLLKSTLDHRAKGKKQLSLNTSLKR